MSIYHTPNMAFAGAAQSGNTLQMRWVQSFPAWFQAIPPERVGLDGEYDHQGLRKRVEATLRNQFEAADLSSLSVIQRGRVVILYGRVADHELLQKLVDVTKRVEGTIRVETSWVEFETDLVHIM